MQSFEQSHDESRWGPLSVNGQPHGELVSLVDLVRYFMSDGSRFLCFAVARVLMLAGCVEKLYVTVPGQPARRIDDSFLLRLPGLQDDTGQTLECPTRGPVHYLQELRRVWDHCGSCEALEQAVLDMPTAFLRPRGQPAVLLQDAIEVFEAEGIAKWQSSVASGPRLSAPEFDERLPAQQHPATSPFRREAQLDACRQRVASWLQGWRESHPECRLKDGKWKGEVGALREAWQTLDQGRGCLSRSGLVKEIDRASRLLGSLPAPKPKLACSTWFSPVKIAA